MIRAVLFDFYDTLAYIHGDMVLAARREIARRAEVDEAAMAALWRDTAEERMLGTMGTLEQQIDTLLRRLNRIVPPSLLGELAAIDLRAWTEGAVLYPEARPALEALKARGYRLGVLSNCSCQAGHAIETSGLADLFDTLALSFRLGLAKPQPEIYLHACAALGVAPTETVFVADGAFGELDAARALGIVAVLIEQPHQSRAYGASAQWDYRVESLAAVPPLIDDIAAHDRPAPPERGATQ
jgi:putative hydrolase of the HAD superfamily